MFSMSDFGAKKKQQNLKYHKDLYHVFIDRFQESLLQGVALCPMGRYEDT